jgi:hypothetical protein
MIMWQAQYQTITDVPAEALFRAISDINAWSEWDHGLEFARIDGPIREGSTFVLKPQGGPNVHMSIEELCSPVRMVDVAHLLLAKLRTSHEFLQSGEQTTVRFSIQISGPLGFFWRRMVGEQQIREAPAQTASFIQYARARPAGGASLDSAARA